MEGVQAGNDASPFSLTRFLSYGTLKIQVLPEYQETAEQLPAEDGWSTFNPGQTVLHVQETDDGSLIRQLDFLISQKFIFISCVLLDERTLLLRIYFIPHDLPGVQGKLRIRKNNITTPARQYLANLLPKVSRSPALWEGHGILDPTHVILGNTLSGIYEHLPSPDGLVTETSTPITRRLLDFSDDLGNFGLRSTLHRYQRRSVAAMVQKEMDLSDCPDPLFFPIVGLHNHQEFYLQPGTMEVLQERPLVAPCRGGILCEELGTGKTVMILALIMSTRHQLSDPEPSIIDSRPVLTPLAFRHFPSSDFAAARMRFFRAQDKVDSQVPTLIEMLLHRMATDPLTFIPEKHTDKYENIKMMAEDLEQYAGPRKANLPFYLDYQGEPTDNERKNKRSKPTSGPRLLYLTSATLVVVPQNLLLQWSRELLLHCDDSLRVCTIRGGEPMPPARTLASEYDLILMSYNRFTAEDKKMQRSGLPTWQTCKCREFQNVRVPDCSCKPPVEVSPLLQIRWKRLVIDEGHVSASLATVLTPFTKILSVERRWIVTGTPTTNLLGLSLGNTKSSTADSVTPSEPDSNLSSRDPSEVPESTSAQSSPSRKWNRNDGEDLTKLGNMITHFVGVPQLLANPQLIGSHIKDALLDLLGPRIGSIEVLMQLMASVMIRHRITDVEEEIVLPPVTEELVLLDLDPLAVKSYNALQAALVTNAVTSERKDQDYMFHPQNADALQLTIQNMSQLMFWAVDDNLYNSTEMLKISTKTLDKALDSASPEDVELLKDAYHHLELAAGDDLWKTIQMHEDVPYRLYDLKRPIFDAWTRTTHPVNDYPPEPSLCGLMHPDRLTRLRQIVLEKPLISEQTLISTGQYVAEKDEEQRTAYLESLKRKSKKSARVNTGKAKATDAAKHAADPDTVKEVQKVLEQVAEDGDAPAVHKRPSALVAQSHIANTRLGSSASSKLNWIIKEVLEHSPSEKFLIFSDSELSLAHIGEGLQLFGIDFLRFTTQTPAKVREQFVLTFETSQHYRVFLMELKHGARGLNLISASRVIFCEPVWRADVESQAIKRCHRIGQTRPISVKTLAIRGTAEENMAARRLALQGSKEKLPKLINEHGMRAFIANPKFITHVATNLPTINVPFVNLEPLLEGGHPSSPPGESSINIERRQVHFAGGDDPPSPGPSTPKRQVRLLNPMGFFSDEERSPIRKVRLLVREPDPSVELEPPKKKQRSRVHFAD